MKKFLLILLVAASASGASLEDVKLDTKTHKPINQVLDLSSVTLTLIPPQIPALDAAKVATGAFDPARIPSLDAAKVATGTFDLARIPTLDADRVPALDAAKVATGAFDPARIPALDAAKVATGTLDPARIPSLDAAKVATGTFDLARIPTLDADRVPALDAAKVATGAFDPARIPALDAAKVATGAFDPARIPALDFSKIATGIVPKAQLPAAAAYTDDANAFVPLQSFNSIASHSLTTSQLANAPAPTVANVGVPGATTWTYKIVAKLSDGTPSAAGPAGSTATGNATLDSSNKNSLTWTAVPAAASYDVYRTVTGLVPSTLGKIANVISPAYIDAGGAGDGTTAPATNATGNMTLTGPFSGTIGRYTGRLNLGNTTQADVNVSLGTTDPTSLQILDGTNAARLTTDTPTVMISRYEDLNVVTGQSTPLFLYVNSTGTTQPTGLIAHAHAFGNSDAVGVGGVAKNFGAGIGSAFGAYFQAVASNANGNNTAGAIGIETDTINETGQDRPYNPVVGGTAVMTGLDVNYTGNGNIGGAAIAIRGSAWDVGIGFMQGDSIRSASIQDDTDSHTVLKVNSGSHTNGINLSGGTYSNAAILTGPGKVGIGESTPANLLELKSAAEPAIRITNTGMAGSPSVLMGMNGGHNGALFETTEDFVFYNGLDSLRIAKNTGLATFGGPVAAPALTVAGPATIATVNAAVITQDALTLVSSFSNGWGNIGGGQAATGYYKDRSGRVWLEGMLSGGTTTRGTAMFNLPAGVRPSAPQVFVVASDDGVGTIEIATTGDVKFNSGSNLTVSLAGISFRP